MFTFVPAKLSLMNRIIHSVIICFVVLCKISAQTTGDSTRYLLPHDSLFISLDEFPEKIIRHTMSKKQTLFGLARHYGLQVDELAYFNPDLNLNEVKIGDQIKVPIPNASIKRFKQKGFLRWKYAPVYYRVKTGDTMFKIAKSYFKMPVDTLKKRNKYWKEEVQVGQVLQVAWLSTKGVPDSLQHFKKHPLWKVSDEMEAKFITDTKDHKIKTQKGVTVWPKGIANTSSDSYILHRTAKIGSVILITNPMNNRKVYVKCIGRLPERVYGNEVLAVVSTPVANLLGVIDERFFSTLKYIK